MSLSPEEREKIAELKRLLPQQFVLHLTEEVREQIRHVSENPVQAGLEFQLKACITKLVYDPKFKGLNSHKYTSFNERYGREIWESYVQNNTPGAWRVFWYYGPANDQITLVLVTPHP